MDSRFYNWPIVLFLSEKRIVDPPPTPHSRYLVPKLQRYESPTLGLLSAEVPGRATNGGTRGCVIVYTFYTASPKIG